MSNAQLTAKHLREVFFGGNWTASNLRDTISDVNWEEAISPIHDFNTIAVLTFHISYYLDAIIDVLEGRSLTLKDELSFDCPKISSEEDWDELKQKVWVKAEQASTLIEGMDDEQLSKDFVEEKYGTYFRNLHGVIEHTHYHLGQIVVLKRLVTKRISQ